MNDKLEMDLSHHHCRSQLGLAILWCVTAFVLFFCFVFALVSREMIQPFAAMFEGVGVEVPWPTRFLLATCSWLLPTFYMALAAVTILIQSSKRDFGTKCLTVVRIFLAASVSTGLVVFILYLPSLAAARKLSDVK